MLRKRKVKPAPEVAPASQARANDYDWMEPALRGGDQPSVRVRITSAHEHAGHALSAGMLVRVRPEVARQMVEHFGSGAYA